MKAAGAVLTAPALPQVNLLPAEVRDARTLGVVKRWMVAAVGVTAFAVVTGAAVVHLETQAAASELAQAEAEGAQLAAQRLPFEEVTTVRTDLETAQAARAFALADEILWADQLGAIVAATPAGVGITSMDYIGQTPLVAPTSSTDPLRTTGLGELTFAALAQGVPDTAAWADALESVPGFSDARIDAVALSQDTLPRGFRYEVTGSVRVGADALSHRFDVPEEKS